MTFAMTGIAGLAFRAGHRLGSIENDQYRVRDLHDPYHRRVVCGTDRCGKYRIA